VTCFEDFMDQREAVKRAEEFLAAKKQTSEGNGQLSSKAD